MLPKATEIKKQIKTQLGILPRQYSIRARPSGYSEALDCVVKDPTLGLDELSNFLSRYEVQRWDDYANEPLMGCNTYVSVSYSYNLLPRDQRKTLRESLQSEWESYLNSPANNYGESCWNPFCPKELWNAFCIHAGKKFSIHPDFVASLLSQPHYCDPVVKAYFAKVN